MAEHHLRYGDLFPPIADLGCRGQIDRIIGQGNGRFLGDVANGATRAALEQNFRDGRYPDLNTALATFSTTQAGLTTRGETA